MAPTGTRSRSAATSSAESGLFGRAADVDQLARPCTYAGSNNSADASAARVSMRRALPEAHHEGDPRAGHSDPGRPGGAAVREAVAEVARVRQLDHDPRGQGDGCGDGAGERREDAHAAGQRELEGEEADQSPRLRERDGIREGDEQARHERDERDGESSTHDERRPAPPCGERRQGDEQESCHGNETGAAEHVGDDAEAVDRANVELALVEPQRAETLCLVRRDGDGLPGERQQPDEERRGGKRQRAEPEQAAADVTASPQGPHEHVSGERARTGRRRMWGAPPPARRRPRPRLRAAATTVVLAAATASASAAGTSSCRDAVAGSPSAV